MKKNNYDHGFYTPENKSKYVGKRKPEYRSSWEFRSFKYMDWNENVLEWSSESFTIPYLFECDGEMHRYYPDIKAKIKTNGGIKTYVIEVKPYKLTIPPSKPKNKNAKRAKRYIFEMTNYIRNKNKWEAAIKYCKKYGYEFKIITERDLWKP